MAPVRSEEDPNQVGLAEILAEYLNSDFGTDFSHRDILVSLSVLGLSLAPSNDAMLALEMLGGHR